jgi:acyl carrier protein
MISLRFSFKNGFSAGLSPAEGSLCSWQMSFESLPAAPSQLARYPAEARDAYERFRTTGDAGALRTVVLAAVRDFMPKRNLGANNIELRDEMKLMEDLGYDSLAVAETVFFFEDLFKVRIQNAELMSVRTIGELLQFVSQKVAETKLSA